MIILGITPLQAAIFATGPVSFTSEIPFSAEAGLVPPEKQAGVMDLEVLTNGYGVVWLQQPMPPFTTQDYALFPVKIVNN